MPKLYELKLKGKELRGWIIRIFELDHGDHKCFCFERPCASKRYIYVYQVLVPAHFSLEQRHDKMVLVNVYGDYQTAGEVLLQARNNMNGFANVPLDTKLE